MNCMVKKFNENKILVIQKVIFVMNVLWIHFLINKMIQKCKTFPRLLVMYLSIGRKLVYLYVTRENVHLIACN